MKPNKPSAKAATPWEVTPKSSTSSFSVAAMPDKQIENSERKRPQEKAKNGETASVSSEISATDNTPNRIQESAETTNSAALIDRTRSGTSPARGSETTLNSSRSQKQEPLSTQNPCGSGSVHQNKAAKYTENDCKVLIDLIEAAKSTQPNSGIDHKKLEESWKELVSSQAVSNTPRTASGLIAKYKTLKGKNKIQQLLNQNVVTSVQQAPSQNQQAQQVQSHSRQEDSVRDSELPRENAENDAQQQREAEQITQSPEVDVSQTEEGAGPTEAETFHKRFLEVIQVSFFLPDRVALKPITHNRIPKKLLEYGNNEITAVMGDSENLEELNCAVYSVARVIQEKIFGERNANFTKWKKENNAKRKVITQKLGWLTSVMSQIKAQKALTWNQLRRLKGLRRIYGRRYKLRTVGQMETLYQDLVAHLKKCEKITSTRLEEMERQRVRSAPLKQALRPKVNPESTPVQAVRDYWERIIGRTRDFQLNEMLTEWAEKAHSERIIEEVRTQTEDQNWMEVCKKARPFKATGPDRIHSFWWKRLPKANELLQKIVANLKGGLEVKLPPWLSHGRAVSLYKGKGDKNDPGNFRTIACLNTCYKLITGMIAKWIGQRASRMPTALPMNQMALKKGVWATTHAHILDRTIVRDAVYKRKPLSIAWIDFAKAFDSVPHKYMLWVINNLGVPQIQIDLIAKLMSNWVLTFEGFEKGKYKKSTPLRVKNGVLQGDTLSPLLFCLCVAPISHYLDSTLYKYTTSTGASRASLSLNHIYYVDDLVIYTPKSTDLDIALAAIERYAADFGCRINQSKSARYHIIPTNANIEEQASGIPTMTARETYKYLGIEKSRQVDHTIMWDQIKNAILEKTKVISESRLAFRQKINALNATIIPKAKYLFQNEVFGTGKYSSVEREARELDQEIRKVLTSAHMRHRSCSTARLYLNRNESGVGLRTIESALHEATVYTYCYAALRHDLSPSWNMMKTLSRSNKRTPISDLQSIITGTEINIVSDAPEERMIQVNGEVYKDPVKAARSITKLLDDLEQEKFKETFMNLRTASVIQHNEQLDQVRSQLWLRTGLVGSEAANNIIAAQEGQLLIKAHPSRAGKDKACRMKCLSGAETAEHILTICPHWRTNLMVKRHNSVARNIYYILCRKYGFNTYRYNQAIDGCRQVGKVRLYWDHPIITVHKVLHNRPDIVVVDEQAKVIKVIEVSVAWHSRLLDQERRKYSKYAINSTLTPEQEPATGMQYPAGDNLVTELGRDYGYKVIMIPIVVGATGEIGINTHSNLEKLDIPVSEREKLIERMARSAAIGSAIIIKAHCSVPYTD